MSWDALAADLAAMDDPDALPPAVRATAERLRARIEREQGGNLHASAGYAEKPIAIRGFGYTPREEGEASLGWSWRDDRFTVDLRVTGADTGFDSQSVRADGSEIGVRLANFTYAFSVTDRWWGPGWDGSQILSNNARPIPALTVSRNVLKPFETKWLSWLGPWDFRAMWGELESDRFVPNANFFGMRFNFRPHPSLEIGLSRTAQLCGEGRPCGLDTFFDMLLGRDNVGDAGITPENEPGNQLAGFDVRWSNTWFGTPMAFYAQGIGEDEAGGFPSRYMVMGGVELSARVKASGTSFRWYAEVAENVCNALSGEGYNCAYNNSIYQTGYRYRGRVIGHAAENDALVSSFGMIMATERGNHFSALIRSGELNHTPDTTNTLTPVPLDIRSIDLSYGHNFGRQRIELGVGWEELEDKTAGTKADDTRGFLRWVYNP